MPINAVQALRGWAALAVCFFHFRIYLPPDHILRYWLGYGKYGVEAFFVLSGFVLTHSLYHRLYNWSGYGHFLWRRIVRLEPPYLLSIVLVIGLRWFTYHFSPFSTQTQFQVDWSNAFYHLAYLIPWIEGETWLNSVYWTLGIEFQFYLVLGLIFPFLVHRLRAFRVFCLLLWMALSFLPFSNLYFSHYALLFGMGIVWWMEKEWIIHPQISRLVLLSIPFLLWFQFDYVVAIVAAGTYCIGRFWERVPAIWVHLGNYSYGIYLLHIPLGATFLLQFGCKFTQSNTLILLMMCATTLCCIAAAALVYHWVEKPCIRKLKD